ncbi:uncharacterized protein [Palaemon carinicauda]|uniref:uncharacterized protein n=1 Tax=Palaemon carinicauda TaxID=392227 RepID=UPI0035B5FD79
MLLTDPEGLECETAPLAPKRQALPARPPADVPADPDIVPRRSPLGIRAPVPVTCQGPPARPRPSAPRRPSTVPEVARKCPTAHTRPAPDIAPPRPAPDIAPPCSPAPTRPVPDTARTRPPVPQLPPAPTRPLAPRHPPVPASRAVPEVPELADRRPQVLADSSRPSGEKRDMRPRGSSTSANAHTNAPVRCFGPITPT